MSSIMWAHIVGSSTSTRGTAPAPRIRRRDALALLIIAMGTFAAGIVVYSAKTSGVHDIVAVELNGWAPGKALDAGSRNAVQWDFAFIGGYLVALAVGSYLAWCVARSELGRRLALVGAAASTLVVLTDCLENAALLNGWRDLAAVAATLKFGVLPLAAFGAACGLALTAIRMVTNSPRALRTWAEGEVGFWPPRPVEGDGDGDGVSPFPAPEPESGATWLAGYDLPPEMRWERPWRDGDGPAGICLSGGGVRAASVSLGALQTLRPELVQSDYLVSVSGGGYTAGAFAQALTGALPSAPSGARPAGEILRDPDLALAAGSVGEEHIRLRSAYLANTPWELAKALAILARHLVLSLFVLFAPAAVLGIAAGWFYKHVPINFFVFTYDRKVFKPKGFDVATTPLPYTAIAAGVLTVAVIGLWLWKQHRLTHPDKGTYERVSRALKVAAWVWGGFLAVTVVLPLVVDLAYWALLGRSWSKPVSIGGSVAGPVLTYLATLASVAWRKRATITEAAKSADSAVTQKVPRSVTQRLFVLLALLVACVIWLTLCAATVSTYGGHWALWTALLVGLGVGVVGGVMDEGTLSLHCFYRNRIAHTFAVRTVRRHDGQVVAAAYHPDEMSTLSEYAKPAEGLRFPEFVFAATANVNDADRTPPGRTALAYTFGADWIGGPDVGWIRTKDLTRLAPLRLQRDLTVQGAVAVSGAAFAAAMGNGGRAYQVLLAMTGARLGSWLPNPQYLRDALDRAAADDWLAPRLPRSRSMAYLLREVFDSHPHSDRLLQVTDGGHYDNLGLIELLRRRCRTIICIDASGDPPPMADTLSRVIDLAYSELGVRIEIEQPSYGLEPGTARSLTAAPGLQGLQARLSQSPILTARIIYPPQAWNADLDRGDVVGRLIVAKAALWRELPYELLSYAVRHPEFPHDSTGDQFFGADEFSAYLELGRQLGRQVRSAEQRGGGGEERRRFGAQRVHIPT